MEDFGGDDGKRVVLQHSTGSLLTWTMSDTWVRDGELPWINQWNVNAFNQAEADYSTDFNSDGLTGLTHPIEENGTVLKSGCTW